MSAWYEREMAAANVPELIWRLPRTTTAEMSARGRDEDGAPPETWTERVERIYAALDAVEGMVSR